MTNDEARCAYYKSESQNVKSKFACEVPDNYLYDSRWGHRNRRHNRYIPVTKQECEVISFSVYCALKFCYKLKYWVIQNYASLIEDLYLIIYFFQIKVSYSIVQPNY